MLVNFKVFKVCSLMLLIFIMSCRSGSINLFKPASPHQAYQQKLINAGLDKTAMGTSWINMADQSLQKALTINIPYKETGYFAAEKIQVSSYRFTATRGQKLKINLSKNPASQFMIYLDIWELTEDGGSKLVKSADTTGTTVELDVKSTATYLMRLQPELLQSGQYTLEITSGPSLGFPVKSSGRKAVQSYFGDGRDANSRKHEGIDIFAAFRTPVIAIADGVVQRVNENNLGGKVVWMRPNGKDYTLYYAHLDEQVAVEGQQVASGDTLGLMGNTGNAKTTPPHLHFGIYTSGGAVDPFPFVDPTIKTAPAITSALSNLNKTVRTIGKTTLHAANETNAAESIVLKPGTVMEVNAANASWYTIDLPDGRRGFVQNKQVTNATKPLSKIKVSTQQQIVYDKPDSLAAVKFIMEAGKTVEVLGNFENYNLIVAGAEETGWVKQK